MIDASERRRQSGDFRFQAQKNNEASVTYSLPIAADELIWVHVNSQIMIAS